MVRKERSAYWADRRRAAAAAPGPRTFTPRVYAFDARVKISGVTGPACLERIDKPLTKCPKATIRVIVRWEGLVKPGARIDTGDGELIVLRVFPMNDRVRVAHLLCCRAYGDEK